ncbi:MAG: YceI family protein, partial [Gammaproteobacteria bacterium]
DLYGILTMHGISKPVKFRVELTSIIGTRAEHEQEILVVATAKIRRSDFGMRTLQMFVNDSIDLCLQVSALRYQTQ